MNGHKNPFGSFRTDFFVFLCKIDKLKAMKWVLTVLATLLITAVSAQQTAKPEEIPPQFRGENFDAFREWVEREYAGRCLQKYPDFAKLRSPHLSQRMVLSFYVDAQGSVKEVMVCQTPSRDLAEIVVAVVESSPRWTPGKLLCSADDGAEEWREVDMKNMLAVDLWQPVVKLWQENQKK